MKRGAGSRCRLPRSPGPRFDIAAVFTAVVFISCGAEDGDQAGDSQLDLPAAAAELSASDSVLAQAALRILGFLRGELEFADVRTADTVSLRLSPEGGGAEISVERNGLEDPDNWAVPTSSGHRLKLVPPPEFSEVTVKPGAHFNCFEYDLGSRAPALAILPHVGLRLAPHDASSCLQTWNLTVVFDTVEGAPVLMAAVYDQWEW